MELRQLRHFLMIMDCGSIGDAARLLKMSQGALSISIKSLERSLGAELFVRSKRGMNPTAFGRSLELRARVITTEAARVQSEIRETQEARRGRVVVGTGPTASMAVLPIAVTRFLETSPNVEVAIIEKFFNALRADLITGAIDFFLLTLSSKWIEPDLKSEVLLPKQRTLIVTSANNPIASKRNVTPKEIWAGPWLMTERSEPIRGKLSELFQKAYLPPPEPAIEFTSVPMAKALLRQGNYYAFLSELLVRDEIRAGVLKAVRAPQLAWERDVGVVYRRNVPLNPAAQKLLHAVREVCKEIGRGP
jgi:DNA-binding transcriptional LysR family regulator